MKVAVDPQKTKRAFAFQAWMKSPMPMVTLTKTFEVSRLCKVAKKRGMKMNMLLCWCIGKAAAQQEEFFLIPEQGQLYQYDQLAINVIVNNAKGGISTCDIPFHEDLQQFNQDYLSLTTKVAQESADFCLEDHAIVGTSTLVQTELDTIVNQYTGIFNNPFLSWGRVHKGFFKRRLPISLQFHHAQMDGGEAATFLESLQREIRNL